MATRTKKAKPSRTKSRVLTDGDLRGVSGGAVNVKFDGIKGESQEDQHKDWIEVLSYSHKVK